MSFSRTVMSFSSGYLFGVPLGSSRPQCILRWGKVTPRGWVGGQEEIVEVPTVVDTFDHRLKSRGMFYLHPD